MKLEIGQNCAGIGGHVYIFILIAMYAYISIVWYYEETMGRVRHVKRLCF
jgi:hypothetical protein